MTETVVLGWVFSGLLGVLLVVSALAGTGRIRLNGLVGIRLPAVKRNASAWRAGHAAAVLPSAVALTVAVLCSVSALFFAAASWGAIIAFAGGFVWACLAATAAASRES